MRILQTIVYPYVQSHHQTQPHHDHYDDYAVHNDDPNDDHDI